MAGYDTFWQKSITQNRKTFIIEPKHMFDKIKFFDSL